MDDATAIWFFQVEPSGNWRMLDYYEASGEGLAHYAAVLAAKARPEGTATADGLAGRGFCYGRHLAPHDIRVRELGTGQSRLESAARLGIRFDIAPSLPLADGIDAVRRALPLVRQPSLRRRTGGPALLPSAMAAPAGTVLLRPAA